MYGWLIWTCWLGLLSWAAAGATSSIFDSDFRLRAWNGLGHAQYIIPSKPPSCSSAEQAYVCWHRLGVHFVGCGMMPPRDQKAQVLRPGIGTGIDIGTPDLGTFGAPGWGRAPPRARLAALRTAVHTSPGSCGLCRGARKAQKARRRSTAQQRGAGAQKLGNTGKYASFRSEFARVRRKRHTLKHQLVFRLP
jgi:hypothetical protein